MNLSENFTLEEMCSSSVARNRCIPNVPTDKEKENLTALVRNVLQPIRDAWEAPVVISSGYRCRELNRAVNGVCNSDHVYGAAADIHTQSDSHDDNMRLFGLICSMAKMGKIKCRQIIDEQDYKWIHVSINHDGNRYRDNQILHDKC